MPVNWEELPLIERSEFLRRTQLNAHVHTLKVNDELFFSPGSISHPLRIEKCYFKSGLIINDFTSKGELIFENCFFDFPLEKSLSIVGGNFGGGISFINCKFNTLIYIDGGSSPKLVFSRCEFQGGITFSGGDYKFVTFGSHKDFKEGKLSSLEGIYISGGDFRSLEIRCTEEKNGIYISGGNIERMGLICGNFCSLSFSGGTIQNFLVEGKGLNTVSPFDANLDRLSFSGSLSPSSNLNFINLQMEGLLCENFNNNCAIKFRNILFKKWSKAMFSYCDMGKMEFNNVNFEDSSLAIVNTSLIDSIFSNVTWPNNIKTLDEIDTKYSSMGSDRFKLLRETYRQLKYANEKQGNRIQSSKFYRLEMEMNWQQLKKEKRVTLNEWIVIWPNRAFSRFGQSFWRPFGLLIFVHLILVACLISSNNLGLSINIRNPDWNSFNKAKELYLNTIFPIHKLEYNGVAIFSVWDALIRIFSSLFIFYIVIASRKYMNK